MNLTLQTEADIDLSQILNGVKIMAPSPLGIHQKISVNLTLWKTECIHFTVPQKEPMGKLFLKFLIIWK